MKLYKYYYQIKKYLKKPSSDFYNLNNPNFNHFFIGMSST